MLLNSSPKTWFPEPMPADAMLILPGLALRVTDELGSVVGGQRGIHRDEKGVARNAGNGRDVADEIELEIIG